MKPSCHLCFRTIWQNGFLTLALCGYIVNDMLFEVVIATSDGRLLECEAKSQPWQS